jgi:hypothetical protein
MDMIASDQLSGHVSAVEVDGGDTEAAGDVKTPRGVVNRGESEARIAPMARDRLDQPEFVLRASAILCRRALRERM